MAEKIRYLRKKYNLTLEEVGNIVGVGKSTVRKWESGEIANMRRDKIAKLAEALHTTPAYLMGWDEEEASTADEDGTAAYISELTETLYRRPGMRILFDAAKDAPDDVLQKTADLLEALKNGQK